MKRRYVNMLTLALLAALSLAACKPADSTETTVSFESKVDEPTAEETTEAIPETTGEVIPETTEVTPDKSGSGQTDKEPPVLMASGDKRLTEDELAKYAAYFSEYGSWYTQALTSFYDSAKDVNISELFYNGFKELIAEGLTDAEKAYLDGLERPLYGDIFRLPKEEMDKVLQQYFGIQYEKTVKVGTEYLAYWEETESFYMGHGDTNATKMVPYAGVQRPNGNIVLFYEHEWKGYCMITVKPVDGGIQIVANQQVSTSK